MEGKSTEGPNEYVAQKGLRIKVPNETFLEETNLHFKSSGLIFQAVVGKFREEPLGIQHKAREKRHSGLWSGLLLFFLSL